MLVLDIPATELFNEITNEFVPIKGATLTLEHSLVSISKWESKWQKPFISEEPRTIAETIDYVRCMTITQNIDPNVYYSLTNDMIEQVNSYIDNPMSATKFYYQNQKEATQKETVTSELIYYCMIAFNIPMECQKWHLNRLLTLIKVCRFKNNPQKMSKSEQMAQQRSLNEARKKAYNTKG